MKWRRTIGWLLWGRPSLPGWSYYGCLWEHETHGRSSWLRTTKPTQQSSIPPRTEPSVKIWKLDVGTEERVWNERSLCWDFDILLSTGVMIVGLGEACPIEEWKVAYRRGWLEIPPGNYRRGWLEIPPGNWDRVHSDGVIERCANHSSSCAVCLRRRRFDDDRPLVEDGPTRQRIGWRWFL